MHLQYSRKVSLQADCQAENETWGGRRRVKKSAADISGSQLEC